MELRRDRPDRGVDSRAHLGNQVVSLWREEEVTLREFIAVVVLIVVGIAVFYFTGIWTPGN